MLFILFVHDSNIFVLILDPVIVPQKAPYIIPILELFKLVVLVLALKDHQDAVSGDQTVQFTLPDF